MQNVKDPKTERGLHWTNFLEAREHILHLNSTSLQQDVSNGKFSTQTLFRTPQTMFTFLHSEIELLQNPIVEQSASLIPHLIKLQLYRLQGG